MANTLYRRLTHKALARITLVGEVIDLGGVTTAEYHRLFKGTHHITTANLARAEADIVVDLEKVPYPLDSAHYDAALLINTLEHIYAHRAVIAEAHRILKNGGLLVIAVPFLHAVHPAPRDYFRYTDDALKTLLGDAGFTGITIEPLGYGAISTAHALLFRFLPTPLNYLVEWVSIGVDMLLAGLSRLFNKKYSAAEYPLGYVVIAHKP